MDIIKFAKDNYGDFVKRANPAMNKMTALQTLLSGKELSKEEVPLIKEFKTVQEFLNLPMGDKKELVLKKLSLRLSRLLKTRAFFLSRLTLQSK